MRSTVFLGLLLVVWANSTPTSNRNNKNVKLNKEFFKDKMVIYTSQHDIVNLIVPINALNFKENDDSNDGSAKTPITLFFVEADIKENEVEEKGLYILKRGKAKKLLDNGRDAAATKGNGKLVHFAAKDGIYVYNAEQETAEKYGTVTDSLIGIAKENGTDTLYVLGEDKLVYKVTEDGNKKVKVDDVEDAEQIVIDTTNNLYYYGSDMKLRVITSEGVKVIEGLPQNPDKITLLRPPLILENWIPAIIDKKGYMIYANGTSNFSGFEIDVETTAYALEGSVVQYYGYNKKIYEYNILLLILDDIFNRLRHYIEEINTSTRK